MSEGDKSVSEATVVMGAGPEATENVVPPTVTVTADDLKREGNEFFAAKKYDEAIVLYMKALAMDPDNAVLYSNRSACYAAKQLWQKSLDDALLSISKDPSFIKAYYRLATAQR
jgi:tetratricopeptide (TPR) repeat protein